MRERERHVVCEKERKEGRSAGRDIQKAVPQGNGAISPDDVSGRRGLRRRALRQGKSLRPGGVMRAERPRALGEGARTFLSCREGGG